MKTSIILCFIALSLSLKAQKPAPTKLHIIEQKIGLKDYPIDKITLPEIIADFGNNFERDEKYFGRKPEKSSQALPILVEVKYKTKGISFYYFAHDSIQLIKAVKFYKPFKAKTKTNIILNESKLGDVLKLYGNERVLISSNRASVNKFKLTSTGISFSSELLNFNPDNFPSEEELKNKIVDEIYISNYQYEMLVN